MVDFLLACTMSRRLSRLSTGYTRFNTVKLVRGGAAYFTILKELIAQAQYQVHLQVYIYDEDETGREIADALMAAAQRGVAVYLLADGYASQDLSKPFIHALQEAGVHFRFFEPVLKSQHFYFGRRLHHKVLVTDAKHCLVGGINISNKYNDGFGMPPWLDWALHAEGEVAIPLLNVCLDLWTKSAREFRRMRSKIQLPDHRPGTVCPARVRRNDWVQRRNQITKSYLEMFRDASSHIDIMSSYFLPGRLLRRNLYKAAKRGVKIRLVLAGVSDIRLAKHAERYIYRRILQHDIAIYEYRNTILHGKTATYDGKWATIGSYNVNNISTFASIELNIDVVQEKFANSLQQELDRIITEDCVQVTEEDYRTKYHFFQRLVQRASYEIIRFIFYMFTFYFKQRRSITPDSPE